jgi:hypothetical protein
MADRTGDHTVVADLTAHPIVCLTADRMAAVYLMAHRMVELTAVLIMAIGSAAGRAGFMAIATFGIASGIVGIRTATTDRVGTFAAPTGSQRDELTSGPVEPTRNAARRDSAAPA